MISLTDEWSHKLNTDINNQSVIYNISVKFCFTKEEESIFHLVNINNFMNWGKQKLFDIYIFSTWIWSSLLLFFFKEIFNITMSCFTLCLRNGHELESLRYWELEHTIRAKTCMESYPCNRWYFVFIAVFTEFMLGFLHEEHNFYFLLTEYASCIAKQHVDVTVFFLKRC